MSLKYNDYLHEHCSGVRQGLQWMADNLPGIEHDILDKAMQNAEVHDNSKMQPEEYKAYDDYFYGGNRSAKVKEAFDYAWLYHIHNNPHHWQYWVLINDDADEGTRALEMPLEYVYEMIADWWSFSWKKGNLMEIFDWYDDHKKRIIFHKNTKKVVETILDNIKAVLKMQQRKEQPSKVEDEDETVEQVKLGDDNDILDHSDLKEDKEKKFGVPEERKFPLPDAHRVRSAIKFFNYVDPKYEKELADAILKRMDEYDLSFKDFGVGDENRFKKYIPEKYLAHHGIQGQEWGKRNGPPYPLNSNGKVKQSRQHLNTYSSEPITQKSINIYKDQAKQLSHVRINKFTNGRIFTDDGELTAMVNVELKNDGHNWIQGLEVFNHGKGQGLSYGLLDYAVTELDATHLSVNKTNTIAKHVYDEYGFKTYDETPDMYFMEIKLGDD